MLFYFFFLNLQDRIAGSYLEVCETTKVELFAKVVNGFQSFAESSILDVSQSSKYATALRITIDGKEKFLSVIFDPV